MTIHCVTRSWSGKQSWPASVAARNVDQWDHVVPSPGGATKPACRGRERGEPVLRPDTGSPHGAPTQEVNARAAREVRGQGLHGSCPHKTALGALSPGRYRTEAPWPRRIGLASDDSCFNRAGS